MTQIWGFGPGARSLFYLEFSMKYLLVVLAVLCGCGGGGSDSCAVVSASGDNSQAACSTGGGIDQDIDQSGDEDELEDLIPECVETCKERGNPDPEIFGLTDGFEACHNDCAGGAFDEEEDDEEAKA